MKCKSFFALAVGLLLLSSCGITSKSKTSTVKTMDIVNGGVYTKPLLADLDVKETKVTATAKGTVSKDGVDFVKNQAVANALKSSNGDILVEPKYDVDIVNDDVTVIVTGFVANYKNFRQLKAEDSTFLKNRLLLNAGSNTLRTNESSTAAPIQAKKSVFGTILGILALTAGVIALATSGG